jgi:hypothetical protein
MAGEQRIQLVNAIAVARGSQEPSNLDIFWVDENITGAWYEKLKAFNSNNNSWELVNRSPEEILDAIKTVDGAGSGLDADTLQGYTPAQLIRAGGGGGSVPALSTGQVLVGQADTIGTAQSLGGIATIQADGTLVYVNGSISHTGLSDIGTNTHAQIDAHISNNSNPHSVTASQVGNTVAQWNANQLQGSTLNIGTPGVGEDAFAVTWDNTAGEFVLSAAGGDSIYTANGTTPSSLEVTVTDAISFIGGETIHKGSSSDGADTLFELQDNTGAGLWDWRNNGDVYLGKNTEINFGANTLDIVSDRNEIKMSNIQSLFAYKDSAGDYQNFMNLNANDSQFYVNQDFEIRNLSGSNTSLQVGGSSTNKLIIQSAGVTLGDPSNDAILLNAGSYGLLRDGAYRMRVNDNESFFGNRTIISRTYTESFIGSEDISLQGDTLIDGALELSTTTRGFLMPRVTTAQMNLISSPTTNEIVYNTDLNGLYRYDGAAWVALSAGYGIIEVIRDSDNGVPKYFSDLQSAIDSTFSVGETSTVTLFSNIEINSTIILTSNVNDSDSITLNLNGFKIFNQQSDTSGILSIYGSCPDTYVNVINGELVKINATGGNAINISLPKRGVSFNKVKISADSDTSLYVSNTGYELDLGGSIIENLGGTQCIFHTGLGSITNFIAKGTAALTININQATLVSNFTVINSGSGAALFVRNTDIVKDFYAYSNTGLCIDAGSSMTLKNFYAYSELGTVLEGTSVSNKIIDFTLETGNSNTNTVVWSSGAGERRFSFGKIINNGSGIGVFGNSGTFMEYVTMIQNNSSYCLISRGNESAYEYCKLINKGGKTLEDDQPSGAAFKFCSFRSEFDDPAGHSIFLKNNSYVFENCSFEVVNSAANCINATAARTTSIANSTFIGATTPINANVTVTASTDLSNGNRQI